MSLDEEDSKLRKEADELTNRLTTLAKWSENRVYSQKAERAFIIEFAGMPKAGKSSAIETIRHFFSHGTKRIKAITTDELPYIGKGYEVYTPAEGVSLRTPSYLKTNLWDFNTWAGSYALQELLQARHDRFHDIVILDRGPWDAGCWLEYVRKFKQDDVRHDKHADSIVQFFQLPPWSTLSDLHVLLTVDPDHAQERERRERLIEHGGFASNREGMKAMQEIYLEQFEFLQKNKESLCGSISVPTVKHIDSTEANPKRIALDIVIAALDVLDAKLAALPSMQPLSIEEAGEYLRGYLDAARGKRKEEINAYLPKFVAAANNLSESGRNSVRRRLHDLSNQDLLAASDRDTDQVVQALENLLQDAENE